MKSKSNYLKSIKSFGEVYKEIKSSIVPNNSSFFQEKKVIFVDQTMKKSKSFLFRQIFGAILMGGGGSKWSSLGQSPFLKLSSNANEYFSLHNLFYN